MSWAKLDDRANEHRKQLAAGPEACWLWACGLMYCNRQPARDGFIPVQMLPMLYPMPPGKRTKLAAKLVEVGLWLEVPGGFQVHDFTEWNKTRDQVEAEREATRMRVAEHRRNKKLQEAGNAVTPLQVTPDCNISVPDPLPSTPLPIQSRASESSARAPEGSEVTEPELRLAQCPLNLGETAETHGIVRDFVEKYRVEPEQIRECCREFVSYWTIGGGMGRKHANWPKKLREHLRKNCEKPGGLKALGEIQHEAQSGPSPELSRHKETAALLRKIGAMQ